MTDRAKLDVLRSASSDLPNVVEKKMFGCEALFTTGGRPCSATAAAMTASVAATSFDVAP